MLSQVGLSIGDNDGDPFDPNTEEEFAEGFTVGGLPADLSGYFNAVNPAVVTAGLNTGTAALLASVVLFKVFPPPAHLGGVVYFFATAAFEIAGMLANSREASAQTDPYDPNYHSLYTPISLALPDLPDGPGLPAGFRTDALNLMQASAKVASYADALYVTENRMLSAIHDSDLNAFQLQNAQLNKITSLLGAAHTDLAQAEKTFASDIANAGLDITITPAQFVDFVSQLTAGGASALPQEEQNILNSFTTDP